MIVYGIAFYFLLALLISGAVLLAAAVRRRRGRPPVPGSLFAHAVDYSRSLFPVLFVILFVRSFIVEPFRIPSGSMVPTLLVGDFILVNKFAYGIRLPVTNQVVIPTGRPHVGDVVVFRFPRKPWQDWIKRVVGVPGDLVAYRGNRLWVNGVLIPHRCLGAYRGPNGPPGSLLCVEHLGRVTHDILITPGAYPPPSGSTFVPPHHYFVMGDDRDDSDDSRYWGSVPSKDLVGEAFLVWFNWDAFRHPPLWNRIGLLIR
jgi:signal peptidase I